VHLLFGGQIEIREQLEVFSRSRFPLGLLNRSSSSLIVVIATIVSWGSPTDNIAEEVRIGVVHLLGRVHKEGKAFRVLADEMLELVLEAWVVYKSFGG
jgi:hypothetical protein